MDVLSYLRDKAELIDEEIDRLIPSDMEPSELAEASRHLVEAGGKRLRPALTITAAEAVGGKASRVLKPAAALELLHTFTLVHDDIMDQDERRRGVRAVHVCWGESTAINAGDALFALVFRTLSESAKSEGLSAEEIISMLETVSRTSLRICEGQALDMKFESQKEVSGSDYLHMVEKKTGALIEASTKIGALLGGGDPEEVESLARYGRLLGIAFQIHDDFLGAVGDQEKVGKPIGSDIRKGKWTFLTVYAYEESSPEDRDTLLEILGKKDATEGEVREVIDIYRRTGAIDQAERRAKELAERAKSELNVISESRAKDFLLKLADFSVEREL